ncbi:MAG: hypothetical protein HY001_05515 [Candidatus Portnoybacteria bacterium]|nr:hypothetical protein [Candidatus Portnoybacteria bacterium]
MSAKKVKRNFWEKFFVYPSFNIRFWSTLILVLLIFCAITYFLLFKFRLVDEISDQIAILNLIIQSATFVLGIFAAYYALRQLVETRFTSLDEAGMQELKRDHYSRAFEKWREAFYIRPEAGVFTNMCESLLLVSDYATFDQYIRMSQRKEILQESSDRIILLYLIAIRHLLIKNQGEAEKHIADLVKLTRQDGLVGFQWDFLDLKRSPAYQNLNGECKDIAENLISYLSKTMQPVLRQNFEAGNFASQSSESSQGR